MAARAAVPTKEFVRARWARGSLRLMKRQRVSASCQRRPRSRCSRRSVVVRGRPPECRADPTRIVVCIMIDLRDQLERAVGSSFRIEHELGGGGMSRVFVAEDLALGRTV